MNPITTARPVGVAVRDGVVVIGSIIAVLGVLGLLTPEQVAELTQAAPAFMTALGAVLAGGMSIYRVVTKSHSDKAAEVAKEVDAKVPAAAPVEIKTPPGVPDIVVSGDR